ncbi:MAG: glycosyltransferase family 2 protein [Chloroflexi bacterium]|nr:glycosyltransferase family 2 protein [Chloroflexota bacterium]
MDLSIIIVNWNTRQFLAQCLQALQQTASATDPIAHTLTCGPYVVEVFVVDNASRDDSVSLVRDQFPWVRLIENDQNVGFAPANNQALREYTGRYALLLNSDTEVKSDALRILMDFMEQQPQAGGVGAHLLNGDGTLQPSCQPMLTPWREFWRLTFLDRVVRRSTYDMERWTDASPRRVEVIKGACLLLRSAALERIGLLDEQYFMYTEEVDLCYRLLQDGWTLHWLPTAHVIHFGEASSKQMAEKMYVQLYRSKAQFYRKFGGEARARQFIRLVRTAYWPRLIAASILRPFRPQIAAQQQIFRRLLNALATM